MLSHSPTPPRSFPSPYLPNLMFFLAFSKKPTKNPHKRNKQKINTKDAKQNETKIHKNIIKPVLCCLTTPDHRSCPRVCLIHPVDPI